VTRIAKKHGHVIAQSHGLVVLHLFQQRQDFLNILRVVQRLHRVWPLAALPLMSLPLKCGVLFLDMAGILEDDLSKLTRRGRRYDPTLKSRFGQLREQAAMIQMGVGQQDNVDRIGRQGERRPVSSNELALLMHSAIDENPKIAGIQQVA